MHIIGTAGHVDHGKSSLVQALTGTNPDRWAEERERGMTLDLGFAHLVLDDGTSAGIVDVPGHARFLHNMLAGAAGMELLLLAVAANEGVMPQTIEHLQILRYLSVRRTIVVVTKIDVLAPNERDSAVQSIAAELAGTLAAGAPMIAVSSETGEGLGELRARIADELRALAPRDPEAPAYLPIDRVFTLAGRGTVVTGTLMQGTIRSGDTVGLEPNGKRARVRSLHVFGEAKDHATGGSRVALNLAGIDKDEVTRGDVVTSAEVPARSTFEIRFEPLAEALPLLRRRNQVRAYIGSAEILGTLVLSAVPQTAEAVDATLHLRAPTLAFPGVHVVVRRISPKTLLGGGAILAAETSATSEQLRMTDESQGVVLRALLAREGALSDAAEIAFAANIREEFALAELDALVDRGDAIRVQRPVAYMASEFAQPLLRTALDELERLHASEPWVMGATSLALSRALGVNESTVARVLNAYADEGRIAHRAGYYSTTAHQPTLSAEQRDFMESAFPGDSAHTFLPISYEEVALAAKRSGIVGMTKAFDALLARGAVVKVGDALYRGSQIGAIHRRIEEYIDTNGRMTMAEFRDLLGTSRKYAVPLLEWFDSRGITVRSGDYRMMRRKSAR
jgi:selenocysteine-specific elongation factor